MIKILAFIIGLFGNVYTQEVTNQPINIEQYNQVQIVNIDEVAPIKIEEIKVDTLYLIAEAKLKDLMQTGYWSHTNSNGCNYSCRISNLWGPYMWLGENLYRGNSCDIEEAYRLWKLSPTHNDVLNHKYTRQVLVKGYGLDGKCYIVLEKGLE